MLGTGTSSVATAFLETFSNHSLTAYTSSLLAACGENQVCSIYKMVEKKIKHSNHLWRKLQLPKGTLPNMAATTGRKLSPVIVLLTFWTTATVLWMKSDHQQPVNSNYSTFASVETGDTNTNMLTTMHSRATMKPINTRRMQHIGGQAFTSCFICYTNSIYVWKCSSMSVAFLHAMHSLSYQAWDLDKSRPVQCTVNLY